MSFYEVDLRPVHDPDACSRVPCGRCKPSGASQAPGIVPNPHDADVPRSEPDRAVVRIGLPAHPDPASIASALEAAAKALRSRSFGAMHMASVLAARGYSAQTIGDGGAKGSDTTSRTERLAAQPDRWDAVDHAYAALLRGGWLTALRMEALTDELVRHALDDDPTPIGQGECRACARFVKRIDHRPSYRLRSGLCPSCFGAWCTYRAKGGPDGTAGPMLWSEWTARRRESLTERDAVGRIVKIHTPEPEEGGQSA